MTIIGVLGTLTIVFSPVNWFSDYGYTGDFFKTRLIICAVAQCSLWSLLLDLRNEAVIVNCNFALLTRRLPVVPSLTWSAVKPQGSFTLANTWLSHCWSPIRTVPWSKAVLYDWWLPISTEQILESIHPCHILHFFMDSGFVLFTLHKNMHTTSHVWRVSVPFIYNLVKLITDILLWLQCKYCESFWGCSFVLC